jgi:hypothetical protein
MAPIANMAPTVQGFATGTYTVRRQDPPTFVKGRQVAGGVVELQIRMVIAPLSGDELQRLPEGTRQEDKITIVSTQALRTDSVSGVADKIEYGGYDFEVDQVADWSALGGFWKCQATRAGKTPP